MTEQRAKAIKEQTDRVECLTARAAACLTAAELIRGLVKDGSQVESVRDALVDAALWVEARHFKCLADADIHADRAEVLRAHAEASVRGAPFRPVERLGVLTSVRPNQYGVQR